MKKSTRFISFFLAMVMILSLFTGMASAEEGENSNETETQQSDNTITTQPTEVELFKDYESFDVQKAPDIITAAEIAQNGYIGRVKSHEKDLHTLVFRNSDGTNTKKIYSHPVKYVDDTGVVRDISLEIGQNKDGSFSTASHEIITTFEKNPLNGITLDYEDVSIKMVPALTGNKVPAAVRSSDNKKITYSLDSSTSYVYELTYTGYKEDIVVKKYTGQTEYMFKLYTSGLTLTKINESYCLVDSEGEVKATIGDVIIFTADERNNTFGSMTYEIVRQNQEYNITIHVDADYLRDPKTVYPIRIDPTIEIRYSNNGAGAIEDVTLNSSAGSDGSSTSLLVGKRNTYGISRVLLKVPALSFDEIPYAVSITSATIGIRDIMCQSSSLDIYCHQFTGGEWSESTANWSNVNPNSYGSCLDSHTVSYANGVAQPSDHSYAFDITSLVRQWYSNPSAQNMGVIFKASDAVEGASAHNHKTFGSYSSSYRPVFTLVYENVTPIIINFSNIYLLEGESYTLVAGSSLSEATISWSSSDSSIATCGTNVGTSTTVTARKAGTTTITATAHTADGFTYTASSKVNVYLPDGVYYIQNMNSNLYLHVDEGGIANFTDVIQFIKYQDSVDNIYKIRQMWKIHHIVNGIYSIRPMNNLDMGLDVCSGNVDIYNIGTNDTIYDIIDDALWAIEWRSNGYVFKNNNSDNAVMQVENSSTQTLASVKTSAYSSSLNCKWALTKVENPPVGVVLYDMLNKAVITETPTKHINVGVTKTLLELDLSASAYSGSSISQTLTWSSSNTSVATVNLSGSVTGISAGEATITGRIHLNGSYYYVNYMINVSKLLIYQTGNTYYHDKYGNYAEDLCCGDLSEDDLRTMDWVSWLDFVTYTPAMHRFDWEFMATTLFSRGELRTVILDMIDHFMDGSGLPYSSSVLTQKAYEHDSTQNYIEGVEEQMRILLNTYAGDISALIYSASDRDSVPLVMALSDNDILEPVYNTADDKLEGLTICIDSLWGNKIEVSSYSVSGNNYSCTLHYTLYDHFGLDQLDVEKYGFLGGFRSWYVLQHYSEYSCLYKPFLTLIEFDVTISGTIS